MKDEEINLAKHAAVLRKAWWKILLLSLVAGLATLIVMFQFPNVYQADAVISPAIDEKKPYPGLGTLAAVGLEIGGPSKLEDLETLLKSKDLTVRVFNKYNLFPVIFPKDFDSTKRKLKFGWVDRLWGEKREYKEPNAWDAIRAAEGRYKVYVNKRTGTLSISFSSPSPEGSADIVKYYLEEGKSRLQEEAIERADRNKKFIEQQIAKTVDPLTRERLYALFGQEVEREMLARNREQFGFRVIDAPMVSDRKSGPHRFRNALLATVVSVLFFSVVFAAVGKSGEE